MKVRASKKNEWKIAGFLLDKAQRCTQIIYFHENGGFLSGFGKLDRFGYLGEEYRTFQNCILRRNKHAF